MLKALGAIVIMVACAYAGTVTAKMQFEAQPAVIDSN
jgi:hypothetical protein